MEEHPCCARIFLVRRFEGEEALGETWDKPSKRRPKLRKMTVETLSVLSLCFFPSVHQRCRCIGLPATLPSPSCGLAEETNREMFTPSSSKDRLKCAGANSRSNFAFSVKPQW